jgi:putative hemolysin
LLSYVASEDPWLKRLLIHSVEWITGRPMLVRRYREIQAMDLPPGQIWGEALKKLSIRFDFPEDRLDLVPKEGPLVIIANHPFGVIDGLLLGHLASILRPKFHFLVNALLVRQDKRLNRFLLPIDFSESKAALKTNLASRQASFDRIRQGEALVIFPAGGVMTAPGGWGRAQELEWKRFAVKMVQQSKATVLPVYFDGQNSRIFHLASRISMSLRLGLLLHEVRNKIGKEVKVVIGKPIPWSELEAIKDRQVLLQTLQEKVLSLAASLPQGGK